MKSYIAPVMVGLMAYFGAGAPVNAEEPKRPAAYELRLQELENRRGAIMPQSTGSIDSRVEGVSGSGPDPKDLEKAANEYESGMQLFRQKKYDAALPHMQEAVRLNPNSADYNHFLGATLDWLGKDEEALGYFQRALDFGSNHPDILFDLGEQYFSLGKKYLESNPNRSREYFLNAVKHLTLYLSEHKDGTEVKKAAKAIKLVNEKYLPRVTD